MKKKTDEEITFDLILSKIIKSKRAECKYSQEFVSSNSGVTRLTIGKWEKGAKTPQAFDLYNVLKVLSVTPWDFWKEFAAEYEANVQPIREAAEKRKYWKYIEQTKKRKT